MNKTFNCVCIVLLALLAACQRAGEPSDGLPNTGPAVTTTPPPIIAPASVKALSPSAPVQMSGVTQVVWLPDGQVVALASPVGVALYSLPGTALRPQANAAPQQLGQSANTQLLTAAEDQPALAWVGDGQTVFAWGGQPGTAPQQVSQTDDPVTGLDLSPDGQSLAYITYDGSLVIQPVGAQPTPPAFQALGWLTNLTFSPDGSQIGGTDLADFTIYILDANSGQTIRTLEWLDSPVASLYGAVFSPGWRWIAWIAGSMVQVMDVSTGQPGALLGHADAVSALAWSPDERLLATSAAASPAGGGDLEPTVLIWDPASGDLLHSLPQPGPVQSLSFSPDGTRLAILNTNGSLQMWTVSR